jgi:hypothetical protein
MSAFNAASVSAAAAARVSAKVMGDVLAGNV